MRKIFLTLSITLLITSCNEHFKEPFSINDLANCYKNKSWSNALIYSSLVGQWKWEYVSGGQEGYRSSDIEKGLVLDFKQDGLLYVYKNNNLILTATWLVETGTFDSDFEFYVIKTDPVVSFSKYVGTKGNIILCDDILVFNLSFLDEMDNYYTKIL